MKPRSEVVLQTDLSAVTTVDIVIARTNEGDFAVCTQCIGDCETETCLTRRNSVSSSTVRRNDRSTCLDVVTENTFSAFVTYVEVSGRSGVVATGDMGRDYLLDTINTSYESDDALNLRIYRDRKTSHDNFTDEDDNPLTGDGVLLAPANTNASGVLQTGKERFYTNRIGRWANYVQVELVSDTDATHTIIEKMELETS